VQNLCKGDVTALAVAVIQCPTCHVHNPHTTGIPSKIFEYLVARIGPTLYACSYCSPKHLEIKHSIGNHSLGTLCSYIMPNTAYFSLELGQCSLLYVLWHAYYLKLAHLLRFRIVISLVPVFFNTEFYRQQPYYTIRTPQSLCKSLCIKLPASCSEI
jgi:hypothetical protein